ncbi:MAG TPA: sulfotransferase [Pilimelia sp.]|nr:sulfotransferase [Pilimelia sp.]
MTHSDGGTPRVAGALPTMLIIGAMKCGTTALHGYLGRHPAVAMSAPKELNFFLGPATAAAASRPDPDAWAAGNWHRGLDWYAAQFDPGAAVRGESSPGYTSPAHPYAAERIAAHLPDVRLVYLVRDPVDRALSQYRHHVRGGTEHRPVATALFAPDSQYLDRSRYLARLEPYLSRFDTGRIAVVALEELRADPRRVLADLCVFLGADPVDYPWPELGTPPPADRHAAALDADLRTRLVAELRPDAERLRAFLGRDLPHWSV